MQMQNVDVVIVGGGMVGLGLAAARKHSALKVLVVEGQLPDPQLGEVADNRVSALSLASQQILRHVGAWDGIEARRLQAYHKMAVWERTVLAISTSMPPACVRPTSAISSKIG